MLIYTYSCSCIVPFQSLYKNDDETIFLVGIIISNKTKKILENTARMCLKCLALVCTSSTYVLILELNYNINIKQGFELIARFCQDLSFMESSIFGKKTLIITLIISYR